jgi:uncharacterized protein (UPF0332 family)
MDDAAKRAYIRTRLSKAYDDLAAAQDNLRLGHLRTAVNRAYYTIFHVASAALTWIDVQRVRHSGTQSAFGEFLVKPGLIEPEFARLYTDARKAREEQDYDLEAAPLTIEEATRIVDDAQRFVRRIEQYLQQVGAT